MAFAAFFTEVPSVCVHDGLAQLLGASSDGIIKYHYADAVRLAGHSCPTVAGAWLMARTGLRALYGNALPERGNITVALPAAEDEGVTGVIGQVLTLVTGAAAANGFHGLGGAHCRAGLLHYEQREVTGVQLRRNDTGAGVEVLYNPGSVPWSDGMRPLMMAVLEGHADAGQTQRFGELWQERVRRILIEHNDDPSVIQAHLMG
ncbi:MAG: hypothetical protein EPN72_01045 [Nevskiaceae bacterium]|nr:MAG: hypothetical protein EPN63_11795 [Nevskiaceae bacterium]TBR74643.1 MAG: hypothetical protein EPN72_01045 [Nevskiaceae bacterium]